MTTTTLLFTCTLAAFALLLSHLRQIQTDRRQQVAAAATTRRWRRGVVVRKPCCQHPASHATFRCQGCKRDHCDSCKRVTHGRAHCPDPACAPAAMKATRLALGLPKVDIPRVASADPRASVTPWIARPRTQRRKHAQRVYFITATG